MPPGITEQTAMDRAEERTGGVAVSAREIPLNGATRGYEVQIRMPGRARGWKVVVDGDTGRICRTSATSHPEAPEPAGATAPPATLREAEPVRPAPAPATLAGSGTRRLYRWIDTGGKVWITDTPPAAGGHSLD